MPYDIFNYPLTPPSRTMKARYPIRQLQVGQSFRVPVEEESAVRAAAAHVNAKFHKWGIYVSVQRIGDDVWCGRCDVPTERVVYRPKV